MNLKLFTAIFFLSSAAIVYMIGKPKLSKEYQFLMEANPWGTGNSDALLLTGSILTSPDTVWQDLIIANKESFTGTGKLNGWNVIDTFIKPFYVQAGESSVRVELKEVPNRGTKLSVIALEERNDKQRHMRMKGLKAGSQLTLLGNFNKETQLFEVAYAYAGYEEDYRALLAEGALLINQIIIVLLCIGFVFLGWHFWSKKNKSTN